MSVFEILMMVCFGLSWPFNIYKSLRSRTAKGKSVQFLFALELGYIAGILHKIIYNNDFVVWLYVLNFLMVLTDIFLYFRNVRLDKKQEEEESRA